ncbi:hypothetical protein [Aquibacillus rhizosphaerae]|uniref:Uncharacterized protein n=1 Tax=Aquibacillus rhizosphaerae TaxID=3051431 RepID=A0ABT7L9G8_9BACI|nr:hypothetical protein [Aquibacillus sp. LR5S19]MDL4842506.1 hypothetical protein [Aquibacillus sp. LR5S19]
MNCENVIAKFIEHALIHGETQYSGDYKKGNKSSDILFELSSQIKSDPENGPKIVDRLLEEPNPSILIWISVPAIEMNYRRKDVIAILRKLASNKDLGIQGHNAEMTLKEIAKERL